MHRQVINQRHLEKALNSIFPNENIVINARKSHDIKNETTEHFLEIDVFLPNLLLGFEFQDFYHYSTTWYYQNSLKKIKAKDLAKRETVTKRGISLVTVPCWWDASPESLIAAINFHRPDVVPCAEPDDMITLNPPEDFFDTWDVPIVGELMLSSFAESPESIFTHTKYWWLGEKYDGIRCLWNQCDLYTRRGKRIDLPDSFLNSLANTRSNFDCEIWHGRGLFHETLQALQGQPQNWTFGRLIAFDNPSPLLRREPFERRYKVVMTAVPEAHPFVIQAARLGCVSPLTLVSLLKIILEGGGEGIIARARRSLYQSGRSTALVKFKAARADMEALVGASLDEKLQLQLPNGTIFEVQKSEFKSPANLKRGDIVTFEYEGRSRNEVPIGPKFIRIRTEISWDDVCAEYSKDREATEDGKFTEKPRDFWKMKGRSNLRAYFENFAKKLDLDPLLPQTWYSISGKLIHKKFKKIGHILKKGGYKQALLSLFPDIGLEPSKFSIVPAGYWEVVENRKKYFNSFAKRSGFDPLVPSNWYAVLATKLESAKGLLAYYGGSMPKALMHLYPNIGLDLSKFYILPANYWQEDKNIKRFFDEFAQAEQFEPLVAKNWYLVSVDQITSSQKGKSLLKYSSKLFSKLKEYRHKRGYWRLILGTTLKNFYPISDFSVKEFSSNGFRRRRNFFEEFAESRSFDSHSPDNWYHIHKDELLATKGGQQVLAHYRGSVMNALFDIFPNIGLEREEFPVPPGHWADAINQKEFFNSFARRNNFDPLLPKNWYSASLEKLKTMKGYNSLLHHCDGSILNGIVKAYPDIGLEISNFQTLPSGYWSVWENRRKFFDDFAKDNGFDPLVPENWYSVTSRKIQAAKGNSLLKQYPGQSAIAALIDVYPELHFDRHKFSSLPNGYWENANNRKEYFDSFAREKKFDPLVPANWKSRSTQLRERKSYNSVLQHYKGGLQVALSNIYGFPPAP